MHNRERGSAIERVAFPEDRSETLDFEISLQCTPYNLSSIFVSTICLVYTVLAQAAALATAPICESFTTTAPRHIQLLVAFYPKFILGFAIFSLSFAPRYQNWRRPENAAIGNFHETPEVRHHILEPICISSITISLPHSLHNF